MPICSVEEIDQNIVQLIGKNIKYIRSSKIFWIPIFGANTFDIIIPEVWGITYLSYERYFIPDHDYNNVPGKFDKTEFDILKTNLSKSI